MARIRKTAAITKTIEIYVYEKDGRVDEIMTGGFLGDIAINGAGLGFGNFRGKKYPISVEVNSLGTVPPQKEYRGNHDVESSVVLDATPFISEDKLEKLDSDSVKILRAISTKDIHREIVDYLTDPNLYEETGKVVGRKPWTAWLDALQEADQTLQLPKYVSEPIYVDIEGKKAIGTDVRVNVNGARFLFGEGGCVPCSGRKLYHFWCEAAIGVFPDGDIYYPAG
jgi:hypothetical protein